MYAEVALPQSCANYAQYVVLSATKFSISHTTVTCNEDQGHPDSYQKATLGGHYYHTKFERNQSIYLWIQANIFFFFLMKSRKYDTLPWIQMRWDEVRMRHNTPSTDMGLGKSEKGGKWCGGLRAAVGPQWGPGAKPLVGVWGQRPQKLKVFSVCHHKKQHSGAWKSDICKSASFMLRPDIYLVILKIALKMSFWCSKNKILAKVSNYLTFGILL